ncbi:MAG: HEAT repeat domain-containing protein, partial [Leptospiraceae bacterium]|nr:HEAT repeat domain-containing protein [Leptospiraceae bacterium]
PRSEDALIQMASDENENTIVRSYAISSLSKLKSTRSIEPIRNILNEINERKSKTDQKKYSSLKLYAMSALVALGDSNVLGELIAYAKDDDASVRLRAIQQLADLEDDSIYELIEYKAQRDPDRRVQTQAKKILEQMKKKREEKKKTESNSSNSNQPIENLKIDGKDSDGNLIHSSDYGTDIVPEKKLNP